MKLIILNLLIFITSTSYALGFENPLQLKIEGIHKAYGKSIKTFSMDDGPNLEYFSLGTIGCYDIKTSLSDNSVQSISKEVQEIMQLHFDEFNSNPGRDFNLEILNTNYSQLEGITLNYSIIYDLDSPHNSSQHSINFKSCN